MTARPMRPMSALKVLAIDFFGLDLFNLELPTAAKLVLCSTANLGAALQELEVAAGGSENV